MDFQDAEVRGKALEVLKLETKTAVPKFTSRLMEYLTPLEEALHREGEELAFEEGSWYRPNHNDFVPAAMLALTQYHNLNRRVLVPASITHDFGYSAMKIGERAAAWEGEDNRIAHMMAGIPRVAEMLRTYKSLEDSELTPIEVKRILDLVATHDNVYVGIDPVTDDQKYHLDADRLFMCTVTSFYKDAINLMDSDRTESVADHLMGRLVHHFTPEQNPLGPDFPYDPSKVTQSEAGKLVPYTLDLAVVIGSEQIVQRANEIREGITEGSLDDFRDGIREALGKEVDWILEYVEGAA